MRTSTLTALLALSSCALLIAGCASTPTQPTEMAKEQILQQEDVKKKQPTVFKKNVEEVRQAGSRALTLVGCEIKKQEPFFLQGRRPNKFGLFVGSGGETVRIFLYPQTPDETQVWVDTDMSFVGIAGQQNWDDKVMAEMKTILEAPIKPQ